ncbi:MAG: hypothetical protein KJ935_01395, partial [Candidatus Omnitrophica bacterium]|nr:hypothetical protein [Candidatus Omnitrophota bacterium]
NPKLVTIGPYTYQYTDTTGLVMNNTYQYRVTVLDGGTVSNTITVFFSAFFRKPQNLEAAGGIMNVYLEWDWPDGNKVETGYWEDGFYIERKKESDLDSAYAVIGVAYAAHPNDVFGSYTDRAFTDSMLRETTYYNYRVRAYQGSGSSAAYSDYSNTVTAEVISTLGGSGTGTGGCFIATAAFGTPMAKEVVALRRFRDRFLLTRGWGKAFVRFYYRYSPTAAEYIRPRPIYCFIVRGALRPLVWLVKAVM